MSRSASGTQLPEDLDSHYSHLRDHIEFLYSELSMRDDVTASVTESLTETQKRLQSVRRQLADREEELFEARRNMGSDSISVGPAQEVPASGGGEPSAATGNEIVPSQGEAGGIIIESGVGPRGLQAGVAYKGILPQRPTDLPGLKAALRNAEKRLEERDRENVRLRDRVRALESGVPEGARDGAGGFAAIELWRSKEQLSSTERELSQVSMRLAQSEQVRMNEYQKNDKYFLK